MYEVDFYFQSGNHIIFPNGITTIKLLLDNFYPKANSMTYTLLPSFNLLTNIWTLYMVQETMAYDTTWELCLW